MTSCERLTWRTQLGFAVAICFIMEGAAAATFRQQMAGLGSIPTDVRDFIQRRANCNQQNYYAERITLGEDDYDSERTAKIQSALTASRCNDVAKDETALKQRYAKNQPVLSALETSKDWTAD